MYVLSKVHADLGYFKTILKKYFSSLEAKYPKRGKETTDV